MTNIHWLNHCSCTHICKNINSNDNCLKISYGFCFFEQIGNLKRNITKIEIYVFEQNITKVNINKL